MDTTQKNREDTARLHQRSTGTVPPPQSAQQNNGAVRSAEEQRRAAPQRKKAPESGKEPVKKTAPKEGQSVKAKEGQRKAPVKEGSAKAGQSREVKAKTAQRPAASGAKKASETAAKKDGAVAMKSVPKTKKAPAKKKNAFSSIFTAQGKRVAPKDANVDTPDKKRAYGNSKPKKTSSIQKAYQQVTGTGEETKKKKKAKRPTPAVIYTQPEAFNRSRLVIQLATVTAIVAAMVFGLSVFFKVETIQVSGAEVYSPSVVIGYSGIEEGDSLLTFSRPRAGAMIKANLPYVDTVRFGIKLPGTVNIIIEEDEVVYAIKDQDDNWWLINSDGRIVEQVRGAGYANHTQVLGVKIQDPVVDTIAVAMENVLVLSTDPTAPSETLPPVTTTNASRLTSALEILKALEANDIVGSAASVNVERLSDIILWYGSRYQVNYGDNKNLAYKVAAMNAAITQLRDYQSGILDVSFTIWPDRVGYTPFE